LRNELCSGFFKHVNIKHVNFYFLTYRHGYHNESEFYYPHNMTNENEKQNIGAISNEENQQNVEVFTMANVQNYILTQRAENTVKNTDDDLTSQWPRVVFKAKSSERPRPVNDIFFFNFRLGTVQ